MSNPFFDHPILNSPYECPRRHWELDAQGQPTQRVLENRRRAEFITDLLALQAERRIFLLRRLRVMFDYDLAELYGVETGALNRAVKRNADRFPDDFMFQLTTEEHEALKCQIGISRGWGGRRRSLPYAFTEHQCRSCSQTG